VLLLIYFQWDIPFCYYRIINRAEAQRVGGGEGEEEGTVL
jgi:hypothetical protein